MRQYQSEQINEIAAALSKCQGELENASKTSANPFYKSKYADLAEVINVCKEPLSNNGLSIVQLTDISENGSIFVITQLNHSSGQWLRGYYPAKPVKDDPQGLGGAVTYARRYAYSAIIGIAQEDDDGNKASGRDDKKEVVKPTAVFDSNAALIRFSTNVTGEFENCTEVAEIEEVAKMHRETITKLAKGTDTEKEVARTIANVKNITLKQLQMQESNKMPSDL